MPTMISVCLASTILGGNWESQPLSEELLKEQDCVIIMADHSKYDWEFIAKNAKLIFDTRNATKRIRGKYDNIYLL